MFTVKQLSRLAGITPRTLRYYDKIGLLKPSRVGENGYRYYQEPALLRLQQILLYRELDLPLEAIREMLEAPGFDVLQALQQHKAQLGQRAARLERLMQTVDDTIAHLKGNQPMTPNQLFDTFNEEKQAEYEEEAMQMYDPEVVRASYKKWNAYSKAEKQRIGEQGNAIYADLLAAMPQGAGSPEVQACIERWRSHMDYFWTPNLEQLLALAEGYNNDPRFRANFDKIDPRLAPFMREAVAIYVARKK